MSSEKVFWVLSQLGKKVLRPGGKELTEKLISDLGLNSKSTVVEFAPGKGFTTEILLSHQPLQYFGIDIEEETIVELNDRFGSNSTHFIQVSAAQTGLESSIADVVLGEAMLTMQADHRKIEIIKEANRLLKSGGFYAIHELGLIPNEIDEKVKKEMLVNLSKVGKVNARPLTQQEWTEILESNGFSIVKIFKFPMLLLEPKRLIEDEGIWGLLKIIFRLILNPKLRKTVLQMKNSFHQYSEHLIAFGIIVQKK